MKNIQTIEERLLEQALTDLAKKIHEAVNPIAAAFAPYVGFNVEKNRDFTGDKFNESLAKLLAQAVCLRLGYYAGYTTKMEATSPDAVCGLLWRDLPPEVLTAIRSVAAEAFLKKIEEVRAIAESTSEAVDNMQRS